MTESPATVEALLAEVKRLRQHEQQLQSLLDSARDAVIAMDEDGRVCAWNPSAERLLGWSSAEAVGQLLSGLIVPERHRAAHDQGLQRFVRSRQSRIVNRLVEVEALRKDGTAFPAELSIWLASEQSPLRFGAFLRDISERRSAQEELVDGNRRFHAVVEHLGEGMMVIREGRPVFFNRQACNILELEPDVLKGYKILDLVHPDDRPEVTQRLAARDIGHNLAVHSEFRVVLGGRQKYLATHSSLALWEGRHSTMTFFTDVTERRQTLDALHRSEERYRAVIEHVGEGMVVVKGTQFVFANQRAADIVQMTVPDMLARGYLHRIHPEDRPLVDERRQRRLRGEAVPNRYEIRILLPDGGVRWLDIGVTMVPWDGETGTLTFFSDVTERKHLESRLKSMLEERETILETSVVGIAFLTADGRFRWCNQAMLQLFGASPAHGMHSIENIYLDRAQYIEVGARVAAAISRGESFQTEIQMRRLDGQTLWVNMSGNAVSPRDLRHGTVWVLHDISRRKALEAELERTASERGAILNNALVGIVLSVKRHHEWVNDKFAEMTGYARTELIGRSSRYLHPDEESWLRFGEVARAALMASGAYVTELQLPRKDGSKVWVMMAGSCVHPRDPDSGVIWSFLDISERKNAEENTRQALAKQVELNQLRTRFVAMTSHEFRTPLATILSSAELLRHYGDRMERSERDDIIQSIENGVQRMTRMLDRVLLIGKSEDQMLECRPAPLRLRPLCEQLLVEARAQFPQSACDVVLDWQLDDDHGLFDEKLLRHVFANLLSNAIKYSPAGGQVRWRVAREAGQHVFEVSDQGIGIPEAELPHLFETFHRASNVDDIAGTGLGLAIVKKAAETHGGSVSVQSRLGQGSLFRVTV